MGGYLFLPEHREFLKNHVSGVGSDVLTDLLNREFGTSYTIQQIRAFKKNNKICSGLTGQFEKGNVSHNKGKYVRYSPSTEFKKGEYPHNYRPVGSERINADGYVEVKIADPKKWKGKHRIVWEELHGAIPKGHVIIFGNGNKLDLSPDNLILVPRQLLAILNKRKLIQDNTDATKTAVIIAQLIQATTKRKRGKRS